MNVPGLHPHQCEKIVLGAGGCWVWTGSTVGNGYGRFMLGGVRRVAHVVVYELLVGPVPDGLELHHDCHNPPCVNPAHLRPVTPEENARQERRSVCPRGHATEGRCRKCKNDRRRSRYHERMQDPDYREYRRAESERMRAS